MDKLYIFIDSYQPNTAAINRYLAFIKGFSELKIKIEVVFIRPDKNYNKIDTTFNHVEFTYLWEDKKLKETKAKYLQQIVWIYSFLKKLKKGDSVIVFGIMEFIFIFSLFKKKINLYHERTEHPDVGRLKTSMILEFFHKLYLRNCKSLKGLFVISTSLK